MAAESAVVRRFTAQSGALRRFSCKRASISTTADKLKSPEDGDYHLQVAGEQRSGTETPGPFSRLSSASLVRSIMIGRIFQFPILYKPSLALLQKVSGSRSVFLNADKNPLIRAMVLPLIYRQFCAGRNEAEVQRTIEQIKNMGKFPNHFLDESSHLTSGVRKRLTGAGGGVAQQLKDGGPPSPEVREALREICRQAKSQGKRLWIDAEQQVYHPAIDNWTIDLMREFNRENSMVVMTTIQAYLKSSRQTVERYLRLAQKEGWSLGIKLVRGAYIGSDNRSKIHDTKRETDECYDSIAHDIITKSWPGFESGSRGAGIAAADASGFPHVRIFLAGHNSESIRKASSLVRRLSQTGDLANEVHYGQLQGMADDIGCELLAQADHQREVLKALNPSSSAASSPSQIHQHDARHRLAELGIPRVYKCLSWGSVQDCLYYLVRRAIENQGAAERMKSSLNEMQAELRRRFFGLFRRGK
ncbi:proline oxidase Put1 [Fonsecaea pedrosoi]|nr:proline oxidase Put1 [Fonsecaea pedrosoi]